MTDRQRFENKALENNATILEATDTMLKIEAVNGLLITTYQFDESGKFISASH